jgi:AcrR family transcriptional regulator
VGAILEAAARILEEQGYRAASTNAIARRAGVSIGSLYQYFASREDVYRALLARHRDTIHPLVDSAMERLRATEAGPSQVLGDLLSGLLAAHAQRPALMHAMETELAPVLTPVMRGKETEEIEAASRLLAARIPGSPGQALASAWLAAEITAMVSRRLAHDPPPWVAPDQVQAAFARAMAALVG